MDGLNLDLDSIMSKLQGVLPILSYIINMFTNMLNVIGSYFGFDLEIPAEEDTTAAAE